MYFIHPSKKKTNTTPQPMRTTPTHIPFFNYLLRLRRRGDVLLLPVPLSFPSAIRLWCSGIQSSSSFISESEAEAGAEVAGFVRFFFLESYTYFHKIHWYIRDVPRKVVSIDEIRKRRLRPRCRWASRRWTSYTPWIFKSNEGYGVTV